MFVYQTSNMYIYINKNATGLSLTPCGKKK
jgi:hypothetical protein